MQIQYVGFNVAATSRFYNFHVAGNELLCFQWLNVNTKL